MVIVEVSFNCQLYRVRIPDFFIVLLTPQDSLVLPPLAHFHLTLSSMTAVESLVLGLWEAEEEASG